MEQSKDLSPKDDIKYDSAYIDKKSNAEYFIQTRKKVVIPKIFKRLGQTKLFQGKMRWVTLGILGLVLIIIATLIIVFAILPSTGESDGAVESSWSEEMDNIVVEAYDIIGSDSDTSYFDSIQYLDEQMKKTADNFDRQFDIRMFRAKFIVYNGAISSAISDLLLIDENSLTDEQKYQLYLALRYAYTQAGDQSTVDFYEEKINDLPKEVTEKGA